MGINKQLANIWLFEKSFEVLDEFSESPVGYSEKPNRHHWWQLVAENEWFSPGLTKWPLVQDGNETVDANWKSSFNEKSS